MNLVIVLLFGALHITNLDDLSKLIIKNKPIINKSYARELSEIVKKYSLLYNIPPNIVVGMMKAESDYVVGAINKRTKDYGILQVNKLHVRKDDLSIKKLTTDVDYSIYHGMRVFNWFHKRYPLKEAIARYNCGLRKNCPNWSVVKKYVDKVMRYSE